MQILRKGRIAFVIRPQKKHRQAPVPEACVGQTLGWNSSGSGAILSLAVVFAGVTQWLECDPSKVEVVGSSPIARSEQRPQECLGARRISGRTTGITSGGCVGATVGGNCRNSPESGCQSAHFSEDHGTLGREAQLSTDNRLRPVFGVIPRP